jgi:hypothetical protein
MMADIPKKRCVSLVVLGTPCFSLRRRGRYRHKSNNEWVVKENRLSVCRPSVPQFHLPFCPAAMPVRFDSRGVKINVAADAIGNSSDDFVPVGVLFLY